MPRTCRSGIIVILLALVSSSYLGAQACIGFPSLAASGGRIAGGLAFSDPGISFGGSITGGSKGFGSVEAGITSYDELDGTSLDLGLSVGVANEVGSDRRVSLCPVGGVQLSLGPNDAFGLGIDARTLGLQAGLAVGFPVVASEGPTLLPFGGLSFGYARVTLSAEGESVSEGESYGILSLGMGLAFPGRVSVRPSLGIPFGLDGGSTVVSLVLSLALRGN